MTYQIADGHNNAAGLANVTTQPACEGIRYPRETIAANGDVFEDGAPFVEWRYGPELHEDTYAALLTQFGLSSAKTNEVTVRTTQSANRDTFANYNGLIVRPQPLYRRGFYRDVVFVVKMLEAL